MNTAIELTAFRGQPVWEFLAAQYLLMIQAGAWSLLAGTASRAVGFARLESLRPWGILAGTGLALAAPLNLVAELLNPGRFATMIYRFHFTSPLSWGVVAIAALTLCGLANSLALLRPDKVPPRALARAGSAAAVGVLVYTWADLGLAAGIAPWHSPWVTTALAASGLGAGMAACLGLDRLTGGTAAEGLLPRLLAALGCAVSGVALFGWGTLTPWPALPGWTSGTLLPAGAALALILAGALFPSRPGAGFWWACLLALAGGYGSRLGVLLAGQAADLGRNLGEPHMMGHAGIPLALAPAALWVCLMFAAAIAIRRIPGGFALAGGRS